MPAIETYFLDTNVLVNICEYFRIKSEERNLERFERYYTFVQQLLNNGHRVSLSRISLLEMYFLYHRWFYWGRKVEERAPFDEMFGRGATYELADAERQEIEDIITGFIKQIGSLNIEFSKVDQSDVLHLAEVLYRGVRPSVEPYNLAIYSNSILESASYLVTGDRQLRRAIEHLRKTYKEKIRGEIMDSFGEDKYPYWRRRRDLPKPREPK